MKRRRFVTGVAVTTAIPAISGCSALQNNDENGDDGGNGNETKGGNNTDTNGENSTNSDKEGSTADEEAAERFQDAIDLLIDNQNQLDTLESDSVERDYDDIDEMRDRLGDVSVALDDAAQHSNTEYRRNVEVARNVVDFQHQLIDHHEIGMEIDDTFNVAHSYYDTEQLDRAEEEYESVVDLSVEAQNIFDELETMQDELNTDRLAEPLLGYEQEIFDYIRPDVRNYFDTKEIEAAAWASMSRGRQEWSEGFEAYESKSYGVAENSYESAHEAFGSAYHKFTTLQETDNLSSEYREYFIQMTYRTDTVQEMMGILTDASQAAKDGNMTEADKLLAEANTLYEELEGVPEDGE